MDRADHLAAIQALLADASGAVAAGDVARALDQAVARLSADAPRRHSARLTVEARDAGHHQLTLPADVRGVPGLEHPPDQAPPAALPGGLWRHLPAVGLVVIRAQAGPAVGDEVLAHLVSPYLLSDTEATVPDALAEPLQCLAAALLLRQLANATAGEEVSTLAADTVDHGGRSARYAARARDLAGVYAAAIKAQVPRSACAARDLPPRFGRLVSRAYGGPR
ncbi:hypothetical protein [Roseospirillum parvum]|uniref:Uncharacterized protein n=1 Tax=Roseospirillum parvum TaxID=83401 RepID=A0A1G8EXD0_9PROT|nr:hypothetical protein [Roseospirillum parvum]SDH74552.1 hypothetical protein SAMN05421742_11171 [Roseospirillum parvum]